MSRSGYFRDLNAGYPGEVREPKPSTNWHDDGTCKYCGHDRDEHKAKCTVVLPGLACRCPHGTRTP